MKVLVVDDSRIALRVTQMFLEAIGHEALCVTSPTEFLTQMSSYKPDALLIDVDMPTIRGDKLVNIIRERRETGNTRIVLQSSRPASELQAFANECGADGVIEKTSNGATFYAAFSTAIGLPVTPEKAMPSMHGGVAMRQLPAPLKTGIEWIDTHHQMLYSTLREFIEQPDAESGIRTDIFLGFLQRYASFHFSAEERHMPSADPDTPRHREEHRAFLEQVRTFQQQRQEAANQSAVKAAAITYVSEWITRHINETDRTLIRSVRATA